jgi:3-hydroxyacyl-[acyl-carrier-protein] dehydratase
MSHTPALLAEALKSLPHGPEFRFVDRLLSLEPGRAGVGEYRMRGDEPWLRGHLPGEPLLPGVLLIEAAAQLAGVVAQNDPVIPPLPGLKLTALRNVKILGSARPGETVRLEARITGRLGLLVQAQVSAFVASAKVLFAELTLSGTAGADEPAMKSASSEVPETSG